MKMKFSKEVTIGLVTIISLTLLYLGVNYLKGINLFRPVNRYFVACTNVKDVTISSCLRRGLQGGTGEKHLLRLFDNEPDTR